MAYGSQGLLTFGGTRATVKLWRPDGKRLLMVSQRSGDTDLYLVDVPKD